jgi:hypothetical protein
MRYPLLKYMLRLGKSDRFEEIIALRDKALVEIGEVNQIESLSREE